MGVTFTVIITTRAADLLYNWILKNGNAHFMAISSLALFLLPAQHCHRRHSWDPHHTQPQAHHSLPMSNLHLLFISEKDAFTKCFCNNFLTSNWAAEYHVVLIVPTVAVVAVRVGARATGANRELGKSHVLILTFLPVWTSYLIAVARCDISIVSSPPLTVWTVDKNNSLKER